ncbi:unnamed protein product [Clonostachys rosea f. rosea IK726]|jgi:hypothetical protein|uniref:Uncharacterized protein n=1 Tax=Clonostachys rosea f. rosea IK726 TaxID=1349383 RepID=A0ACA9UIB7_BIOOC|nr:unnamed protein product [Clonostachys rosea f. rosea IK726]
MKSLLPYLVLLLQSTASHAQNTTDTGNLSKYGLTTVDIQYQVHSAYGSSDNVTSVQRRVAYSVINGMATIDGDIVYGTEADIKRDIVSNSQRRADLDSLDSELEKRAFSIRSRNSRWPGAIIGYSFDTAGATFLTPALIEDRKQRFRDATKRWSNRLKWLQFSELTDSYDKNANTVATRVTITFVDADISWWPVGMADTQKASVVLLGNEDDSFYVHGIGHILGLHHEHQRPDRYRFFNLECANVIDFNGVPAQCSQSACQGWGCQFAPITNPLVYNYEGPYDTNSVMHYFEWQFGKSFTQKPLMGVDSKVYVGRGSRPSLMDLVRVCEMYPDECRGICGDGIYAPSNYEECDPGPTGYDPSGYCTEDCKIESSFKCGNFQLDSGEECDDGPSGSATCTPDCKKRSCLKECNPNDANSCDITTSCIPIEGGSVASQGKHYCACRAGFRAPLEQNQMRLPWFTPISQEGRVFVEPGQACNILCNDFTLGRDGCKEVSLSSSCY